MAGPGISMKNTKKYPQPEIPDPPKTAPKKSQNIKNARFGYFSGILGVFTRSSRISGREVFFSVFFVEIPRSGHSGLSSRQGHS